MQIYHIIKTMLQKPLFLLQIMSLTLTLSLSLSNSVSVSGNPSPSPAERPELSNFKPTVAVVIIGALTAIFSVTFLLLLYARHISSTADHRQRFQPAAAPERKNSGVSRAVVESLPVFRFGGGGFSGDLTADCAVCLGRYDTSEVLRLLPKCRHAFHVECVDTWLDAHSTCPLCRFRVDPEDILLLRNRNIPRRIVIEPRVISNRHSSSGERVCQLPDAASFRRSLDSWKRLKNSNNRKDGKLLEERRRRESGPGNDYRWSDVQPSDLISLQSEMMITSDASRGLLMMGRLSSDSNNRRREGVLSRWRA